MLEGLVINSQKNKFNVKTSAGIFLCDVKGSLFESNKNNKNFIITGDKVVIEALEQGHGIIFEIKPRKSEFYRYENKPKKSELHKKTIPFDLRERQMIAANVDQAIIVFSVKNPKYKTNLIDRYLILLKKQNIVPIICFNKADLCKYEEIKEDVDNYEKKGIKVIITSSYKKEGIDQLKELLKDKLSVFSGSSGVGKSTLINKILESKVAKTTEVSTFSDKGKHTTTSSNIYELSFGGMLIDTPGIKSFDFHRNNKDIDDSFNDIATISKKCKFKDCKHQNEPDCAVKLALTLGEISEKNYNSYIKLKSNKIVERKKHQNIAILRRKNIKNQEINEIGVENI